MFYAKDGKLYSTTFDAEHSIFPEAYVSADGTVTAGTGGVPTRPGGASRYTLEEVIAQGCFAAAPVHTPKASTYKK